MLKAVLIDDEQDNIAIIQIKLGMICPDVEVVATFTKATEALLYLQQHPLIDLLFLDVEMPDLDGFQLLEALPARHCEVILVTAHSSYALQALKASAIDYLLKPVTATDLRNAVNRVIEKQQKAEQLIELYSARLQYRSIKKPQGQKIMLHSAKDTTLVSLSDIVRVSAESNYSIFFLSNGNKITVSKTLKDFEEVLDQQSFFRIHKSHVINLNYLKKILKHEILMVQMTDGSEIEVSLRRKADLLKMLDNYCVA